MPGHLRGRRGRIREHHVEKQDVEGLRPQERQSRFPIGSFNDSCSFVAQKSRGPIARRGVIFNQQNTQVQASQRVRIGIIWT